MKILYLSPNGYLGGAERFIFDVNAQHLENSKIDSEILFLNDGEVLEKCREKGIKYSLLPFQLKLSKLASVFKAINFLRRKLESEQVDILHCTMPYSLLIGSIAALFAKHNTKVVWFQHGPVGGVLDRIAMYFPVDKIIFNSTFTQNSHNKIFGSTLFLDRQEIINLGVSPETATDEESEIAREQLLSGEEKILITAAGRICSWKGFETAIEALDYLRRFKGDPLKKIKLVVIGEAKRDQDKQYLNNLKKLTHDLNLEKKVIFLGHVDNIQLYLKASDYFFHCSKTPEPFGLIVAEAMLNKALVIGSDEGGVVDLIENEKTGFCYRSSAADAGKKLAYLFNSVLNMSIDDRKKITENAAKKIIESYNTRAMEGQIVKIYEELGVL